VITYRRDFKDKGLATLGDSLINFIYSLALSEFTGRPTGGRVPNSSLAIAIERAKLRHLVPPRTDKHGRGDIAEAIIAYAWLENALSMEEAVEILKSNFTEDIMHPTRKKEAIGVAFGELLRVIKERLEL